MKKKLNKKRLARCLAVIGGAILIILGFSEEYADGFDSGYYVKTKEIEKGLHDIGA